MRMKQSLLAFTTDVRELLIPAWWPHLWPSQPLFLTRPGPVGWLLPVPITAVISWPTPTLNWRPSPRFHIFPNPAPITLLLRSAQTFSLLALQSLGQLSFLPLLCRLLHFHPGWPDSHHLGVNPHFPPVLRWPQASSARPPMVQQLQAPFQHVEPQFLVAQVGAYEPPTPLGTAAWRCKPLQYKCCSDPSVSVEVGGMTVKKVVLDVLPEKLTYLVSDLNPFTEYTFRVTASTAVGEGPATDITEKTREQGEWSHVMW